jgi:hypothetical protein
LARRPFDAQLLQSYYPSFPSVFVAQGTCLILNW